MDSEAWNESIDQIVEESDSDKRGMEWGVFALLVIIAKLLVKIATKVADLGAGER